MHLIGKLLFVFLPMVVLRFGCSNFSAAKPCLYSGCDNFFHWRFAFGCGCMAIFFYRFVPQYWLQNTRTTTDNTPTMFCVMVGEMLLLLYEKLSIFDLQLLELYLTLRSNFILQLYLHSRIEP